MAAFTLLLEYRRQQSGETRRENSQLDRLDQLESTLMDIELQLEKQRTENRELTRLIYAMGNQR